MGWLSPRLLCVGVGVQISVWDKEKVLKDNFIGAYQLDCLSVYCRVRSPSLTRLYSHALVVVGRD